MNKLRELIANENATEGHAKLDAEFETYCWLNKRKNYISDLIDAAMAHVRVIDKYNSDFEDNLYPRTTNPLREALRNLENNK
jgi:hypothetical protein